MPNDLQYCTVDAANYATGVRCPAYGSTLAGAATKTFDTNGDVLTSTNADGDTTTSTYGLAASPGLPATVKDPDGVTTTYTYNGEGEVLTEKVTDPSPSTYSATTQYAYDGDGRRYCEVDPYEYAKAGRCPSIAADVTSNWDSEIHGHHL